MLSALGALFICALLLVYASIRWYVTIPKNLPPGPLGLPFFGFALDALNTSKLYKKLRAWAQIYGPIYKLYVADRLVVVLSDYNLVHEALVKQGDLLVDRPELSALMVGNNEPVVGLAHSNGELWKLQRRFVLSTLREFGFGKPILEPHIKDEAEHLIKAINDLSGKPFDPIIFFNKAVANVVSNLVFGRRFDYEDEKFDEILSIISTQLSQSGVNLISPLMISCWVSSFLGKLAQAKSFSKRRSTIRKFITEEISITMKDFDVQNDEPSNYVQAFVKAQNENRDDGWTFTERQLIASVSQLFVTGTDSVATTLRWGILFLAYNPQIQDKIFEEIRKENGDGSLPSYSDRSNFRYTEASILELLRLAISGPLGVPRKAIADFRLCGYDIPQDTIVAVLMSAILWNPEVYPNPKVFDPNRFMDRDKNGDAFTHLIPFQAGKRVCLGESLARMEMFIFITALLSKFKFTFPSDRPIPDLDAECASMVRYAAPFEVCALRRNEN